MFKSFVIGGFDCTHTRNVHGTTINHRRATLHATQIDEDYRMLANVGIRAVRDGAPWPAVQSASGQFDWRPLDAILAAAEHNGIDVIHDFCHFGVPDQIDLFSPEFVKRFAEFCYEATRRITSLSTSPLFITPINEPSYFAWAGGHAARFPPYCRGRAYELKVQLVRAILAGIDAIWAADPGATIINVDPICRAVAPLDRPDLTEEAERFNQVAVYESLDMLSGRLLPELGGSRRHLGVIGVNYYWTNQWELGREDIPLTPDDPRAASLSHLLRDVWRRYGVDILISESSHIDDARAAWTWRLTSEVKASIESKIPLRGVCLYPILGMPSWHEPNKWLHMGMWDIVDGRRVLHEPMLAGVRALAGLASQPVTGGPDGRQYGST